MGLPQGVLDFLNENAENNGAKQPAAGDDLFKMGALDSFALVDFIGVLETETGVKVPDADVKATNFQTLEAIEGYVDAHKG